MIPFPSVHAGRSEKHSAAALQLIQNLIRVARILLELAIERDGKMVIAERLAQKDLAARVGASREMINRILRDLTTGGYVSVKAGRITINKAPPPRW